MKLLGDVLKLSTKFLEEHAVLNPRRSAEEILSYFLKKGRLDLYMNFEMPLQEKELQGIRDLLKRRCKGVPFDYIIGEVQFHKLELTVNPSVLIPRQETEILLSKVVERLQGIDLSSKEAWDLCCGSGCLGLGLKQAFPSLNLILSDLSEEALDVAKLNATKNGISAQFLKGDLLEPFEGKKADVFLCNPPYISQAEYATLHPEVKNFEPKMALCAGIKGSEFYERLSTLLPLYLNPSAKLFFEIGYNQGEVVKTIFSAPYWKDLIIEKDWAGHPRYIFFEYFP